MNSVKVLLLLLLIFVQLLLVQSDMSGKPKAKVKRDCYDNDGTVIRCDGQSCMKRVMGKVITKGCLFDLMSHEPMETVHDSCAKYAEDHILCSCNKNKCNGTSKQFESTWSGIIALIATLLIVF
ncbi:hypothetical protein M3Y98_00015300 [Aphelenchoides besseyi]|nr:hypothetical protein M3Y98_00015300 [Aphelenchoides besseyi]KAI6199196.1 hypothetical protein M3Y96_00600700 [Aphelenchoides besseyi]